MNLEELREYCLSKPLTEETLPFGPDTLVFKVGGKMFAACGLDHIELSVNLKCDPDKAIELRSLYPSVKPGYHMNKRHWNTVLIDGTVDDVTLIKWIDDSYNLVFSTLPSKIKLGI